MVMLFEKYHSLPIPAKASMWFLVCSVLQKGVSMLTTPLFTRLMTSAEYGSFAVFQSWMQIVGIFVTLNICTGGYMQGLIKFDHDRAVYSSTMQGLTFVLVATWSVIYFVFREFWNNMLSLSTFQMLAMFLIIWASSSFGFWAAEQRVYYRYHTLVALTLAIAVIMPIIEVAFIFCLPIGKVDARIAGQAITYFAAYSFLFVSQVRRGRRLFSRFYWRYALAFNLPLVVHYLSQVVLGSSDRIMIGRMVGSREAGIYSLAYSVSLVMTLVSSALMQSLAPWIYTKIKERRIQEMDKIVCISAALVAIANLVLIGFAPEVVAFFAPPGYNEAIYIMPPVIMSVYFMYLYDVFAKFAFYQGKTRLISVATMLGAIFNILLNFAFIPLLGYRSAGYTTLICYISYAVFHYFLMRTICEKYYNRVYPFRLRILMSLTVIFMLIGFVFLAVYDNIIVRYSLLFCMFTLVILWRRKVIWYISICLENKN